ncbi:MAG TPA: amidohydrolase family protein, partial [Vicinamibacteria bacterium]|nr:amidohydrolase family protein [Vicinamibacteria bacterium]
MSAVGRRKFLKLQAERPSRDFAIVNARMVTMDVLRPEAEAALVSGTRISFVGTSAEVRSRAPDARVFDARRRVVVPGFVDAHTHFELTCLGTSFQAACHTPPYSSLREIAKVLASKASDTPKGQWVIGRGSFGMREKIEERTLPTRHDLDAITTEHPLVLFSGLHVAMLNTRGLKELGLWAREPPRGVRVLREAGGQPSGVATEVWDLLPGYPLAEVRQAVRAHAKEIFISKGTTSLSTIPFSSDDVRANQELQAAGELPLRIRVYYHVPRVISLDSLLATGLLSGAGNDLFRYGGIKIFVNGTISDGLGNAIEDFKWTQAELSDFVTRAHDAGIQLLMHVLSRDALLMAAAAVEEAVRRHPKSHRHRVEHGGDRLDAPEDMKRLKAAGIRVVCTPHFGRRPGTASRVPRFRTMIEEGIEPIAVTDTTGTVPEASGPLFNIACAMTPKTDGGAAPSAEEALTFEEALRMHTIWAAAGGFEEQDKGSIAAGKLGDFAVLSDDPRGR